MAFSTSDAFIFFKRRWMSDAETNKQTKTIHRVTVKIITTGNIKSGHCVKQHINFKTKIGLILYGMHNKYPGTDMSKWKVRKH